MVAVRGPARGAKTGFPWKRLVRPGSMTYEATTNEYTLERVDGTCKISKLVRDLDGSA